MVSNIKSIILISLCSFGWCSHNLDYSDLEALNANCPTRDRCQDYRNNLTYEDRSCECDSACVSYNDCCIDARARRGSGQISARNDMSCLNYGEDDNTGVYVVATCSRDWTGPREVRQKCVGSLNLSDPLAAAPTTDVTQKVTYRNLYCAECNNANMASLSTFHLHIDCDEEQGLADEQILADLTYDRQRNTWGIYRLNPSGNAMSFKKCDIIFDVPGYLNNSVRFCRSAFMISTCASNWPVRRDEVRRNCGDYMAVVYDNKYAYRNPHCAICNHKNLTGISCTDSRGFGGRRRPMSFALLLDVNQRDGDQVGMRRVATPQCPHNHKYDPFFKKCRPLVCALPGHVVVNGKCMRG